MQVPMQELSSGCVLLPIGPQQHHPAARSAAVSLFSNSILGSFVAASSQLLLSSQLLPFFLCSDQVFLLLLMFLGFSLWVGRKMALPWVAKKKTSKILMSCEAHQGATVGWWMMIPRS
jgi:hypothetical protein